ncbi:MAG: ion channel [Paracoccaceae bacterium]
METHQMFVQIGIGSLMMVMNIVVAGLAAWGMEAIFARLQPWLVREPHRPKLMVVMLVTALTALLLVTVGVWLWAFCFRSLGIFITMEGAVYFSLVAYTTLGYGDILLTHEWRILGGMAAANGLLNIGLLTAIMVEALRHVRLNQIEARKLRRLAAEEAARAAHAAASADAQG